MRAALTLALALLALGAATCGYASKRTAAGRAPVRTVAARATPSAYVRPPTRRLKDDGDDDGPGAGSAAHSGRGADGDDDSYSDTYYDFDDGNVLYYGHAASAADAQAVFAAIREYYASAARADGAAICRQVSASLIRAMMQEYAHGSSPPGLRGSNCPEVMAALLGQLHGNLSQGATKLRTGVVRVNGATAQILVSFNDSWPSSYVVLQRERGVWRVTELLPQGLP